MRILILHSRYLSGPVSGENQVVNDEARLLREAGHDVEVLSPSFDSETKMALPKAAVGAIWSRPAVDEVGRVARSYRPDVVHCHNLFPMLSPAVLRAASAERAAVVMSLHNYRLMCLPSTFVRDGRICEDCLGRPPWRGVVYRCYRDSVFASGAYATSLSLHRFLGSFGLVHLYLAVSRFVRDKHVEAGFDPARVRVKRNFSWEMKERQGPGEYFLYLGRLVPEKGVGRLLDAWRHVTEAPLLIVGEGPESDSLRREPPSGVQFLGAVPGSEVPAILSRARALVVPSLWHEPAARAVTEAFSSGVPVLASNMGGLPELVEQDVSGLVLPADDAEAWGRAVEQLLAPGESERLGRGARRAWQEKHSPKRALDELEDAYAHALQSARRSSG